MNISKFRDPENLSKRESIRIQSALRDSPQGRDRAIVGKVAIAVGHVDHRVGNLSFVADFPVQPFKRRPETGASPSGDLPTVKIETAGFPGLLFPHSADIVVAFDDGESGFGNGFDAVQFAENLGKQLIRHRPGSVDSRNQVFRTRGPNRRQANPPP